MYVCMCIYCVWTDGILLSFPGGPILYTLNTSGFRSQGMMMNMGGRDMENMWCSPGWIRGIPAEKLLNQKMEL